MALERVLLFLSSKVLQCSQAKLVDQDNVISDEKNLSKRN